MVSLAAGQTAPADASGTASKLLEQLAALQSTLAAARAAEGGLFELDEAGFDEDDSDDDDEPEADMDEAEENAATTSYEYRPPARRFRETSRDDFDFGSDARSRLVGVTASELRAKNDELRWRRERRERVLRACIRG